MNTANGYPDQYSIDQDRQRIARMSLVLKGLWCVASATMVPNDLIH